MKLQKLIFMICCIIYLASCAKPSTKASGTYIGNAFISSDSYQCSVVLTANGDNMVDFSTDINTDTYIINGISASITNNVVTLIFANENATEGQVASLSAAVTDNVLAFTMLIMQSDNTTYPITYSGNK